VVVVDEHVDVHDYADVFFRVCANVDPKRDVVVTEGPADQLDHSAPLESYGGKIGIDATEKGPTEGARPWPEEIVMSTDVRELVDRRWAEYAVPAAPSAAAVQNGPGRRLRRLSRR
jgi:4-hydroxy-3-polyprenylbenzoate decarboxylase